MLSASPELQSVQALSNVQSAVLWRRRDEEGRREWARKQAEEASRKVLEEEQKKDATWRQAVAQVQYTFFAPAFVVPSGPAPLNQQ